MFHYHFRSREAFIRAVIQVAYDEMYAQLLPGLPPATTAESGLRGALRVIGRFLLVNRALMSRILADALAGNVIARDFLRENFPRHLRVVLSLVATGQANGEFRQMAPLQAFAFCAGAMGMPVLLGNVLAEDGGANLDVKRLRLKTLLTRKALDERIDLAISALAAPTRQAGRNS